MGGKNDSGKAGDGVKRWKWPLAWLVQMVTMAAAGALVALTHNLSMALYGALSWAAMPALGLISAYRATRRGLLNYAAWIAPPVCMALSHWLLWGYLPDPGPVLLCALISLVGAAAGEVMNQRKGR